MKKSDLIRLLFSNDEEEVFITIDDTIYDIDKEVEHQPEAFDGFYSYFPASFSLKAIEIKDEDNDPSVCGF